MARELCVTLQATRSGEERSEIEMNEERELRVPACAAPSSMTLDAAIDTVLSWNHGYMYGTDGPKWFPKSNAS